MNRIAIIHMGAVGDLVQTLPTLAAIRRRWPEAHLALVGRPERTVLARLAGLADERPDYDTSRLPATTELVIDFLGAPLPGGLPAGAACVTLPALPPADDPEPAATWIFRHAAERLDLPAMPLVPEIPVSETVMRQARATLDAAGVAGRFVAIHPGSGSVRKNWPLERFIEIARRIEAAGRRPIWFSGPAERDRGTLAALHSPSHEWHGHPLPLGDHADTHGTWPRKGKAWPCHPAVLADLPLDMLAGVVALAEAYVGNDSGITQVAAAVRRPGGLGTPVVAMFGPSNAAGWAPRGRHVHIVRSESGTMEAISVEAVWAALP